jgi:HK97 family phage prohead protease
MPNIGEIERRTMLSEAQFELRATENGEKQAVITGYGAVFNSESRNLGGFVETIHPAAFDEVLSSNPDVIGVFNHDRNLLLGRTSNGTMKLTTDAYGLRYEITPNTNTSIGKDTVEWVRDRTVVGSSFAFAISKDKGDSWSTDARGMRRREVRNIALLEDVGPVARPAYDSSSVVVSRRAIELALGDINRPNQTMANAAKRGLKLAERNEGVDGVLVGIAERLAAREIVSIEEVAYLSGVYERCLAAKTVGWSGTPAWVEWQLAGGDTGQKWVARRSEPAEEVEERAVSLVPSEGMAAAARRGLKLHEAGRSGDGLKPETVPRAKRIAAREELTPDHVREMRAWFARHKVDRRPGWDKAGEETPGFVAWELWGGNAGQEWSESKVKQMDGDSEADESREVAAVEVPAEIVEEAAPVVVESPKQERGEDFAGKIASLKATILRNSLHGDS